MDFDTYKSRYNRAYDKQLEKLNILEPRYSDGQLQEAYLLYTNHDNWFYRAFKPATMAQTNVVYYDWQIREAFRYSCIILAEAELINRCRTSPDEVRRIVDTYYRENNR